MENNSRIRFNPVTKEIEVEGTEHFVKTYFNKFHAMLSGAAGKKAVKAAPVKAIKARTQKKAKKVAKKKPSKKRITNLDSVIGLILGKPEGISTAELKEKTGLSEIQIWNIINRAAKAGQIRKMKRGLYAAVASRQEA